MNDINNEINDHENNNLMIQFENNEQKGLYVLKTLREWAIEEGVLSIKKLNNLLLKYKV